MYGDLSCALTVSSAVAEGLAISGVRVLSSSPIPLIKRSDRIKEFINQTPFTKQKKS